MPPLDVPLVSGSAASTTGSAGTRMTPTRSSAAIAAFSLSAIILLPGSITDITSVFGGSASPTCTAGLCSHYVHQFKIIIMTFCDMMYLVGMRKTSQPT